MAVKKKILKKQKVTKKKKAVSKTEETNSKKSILKSDIRTVGKYSLLLSQKIDAELVVKKLSAKITELTGPVLDYFQRQGVDQISVEGRTLYLRRELHTTKNVDFTTAEACLYLTAIGLEDYVGDKVNTQGLGAYVRELEDGGRSIVEIQAMFDGRFNVVEVFKIGSRKR